MGITEEHRYRERIQRQERYAQAARTIRKRCSVEKLTDESVQRWALVLYASATMLEAASHGSPEGWLRDALDQLAKAAEGLPTP